MELPPGMRGGAEAMEGRLAQVAAGSIGPEPPKETSDEGPSGETYAPIYLEAADSFLLCITTLTRLLFKTPGEGSRRGPRTQTFFFFFGNHRGPAKAALYQNRPKISGCARHMGLFGTWGGGFPEWAGIPRGSQN